MDKRLQPSGHNSTFNCFDKSYEQYIAIMQEVIGSTRVDLTPENHQKIVLANSPKQHVPAQGGKAAFGILLVHGLFDSPMMMSSFFDYYQQQDILVRSLLLPGHGTVPGDLLEVNYHDWLAAVEYGIQSILQDSEQVFVIGFSMGGLLALLASYEFENLAGVFLIAPAIELKHPLAKLAHWPQLLSRFNPKFNWRVIRQDNDYAKYQSHALNAITQIIEMIDRLEAKIEKISLTTPVFMTFSEQDEVIDGKVAENFFAKLSNPRNRCLIYSNQKRRTKGNIYFRPSCFPKKNVIDFSHVCIPIAEDHPHYGLAGDYDDTRHLKTWLSKCLPTPDGDWHYGAASFQNIRRYRLKRLTFNPDFNNLVREFDRFIAGIVNKN